MVQGYSISSLKTMWPSLQGSVPALVLTPLVKGHMDTKVKATPFTSHWRKRLSTKWDIHLLWVNTPTPAWYRETCNVFGEYSDPREMRVQRAAFGEVTVYWCLHKHIMQKKHTQKKKHILKATTTTKLALKLTEDLCKWSHLWTERTSVCPETQS